MKDILVVEDGRQERERLEKLFSQAGYSVCACEGVADAEENIKRDEFRLAVLDIGLNDRSGSYLFNAIKRGGRVSYIIIFTGNPSVHLKQRFIEEGAVDYIVKGSPHAQSDAFLGRVNDLIGQPLRQSATGLPLEEFLSRFIAEASRQLFLDADDTFPECSGCKSKQYVVTFTQQAQIPPEIKGLVVCAGCGKVMDPEIK